MARVYEVGNENNYAECSGLTITYDFLPLVVLNGQTLPSEYKSLNDLAFEKGIQLASVITAIPNEDNKLYTIVSDQEQLKLSFSVKKGTNNTYFDEDGIIELAWSEEFEKAEDVTFETDSFETSIGQEFTITINKRNPLLEKEVNLLFLAKDNNAYFDSQGKLKDVLCGKVKIKFVRSLEYVNLKLKFNNQANNEPLAYAMVNQYTINGSYTYSQTFDHEAMCPNSPNAIMQKQSALKHLNLYKGKIKDPDNNNSTKNDTTIADTQTAFKSFWTNRDHDIDKFTEEQLLQGIKYEEGNRYTDENGEIDFKILKSALINSDVKLTLVLKDISCSLTTQDYSNEVEVNIKKQTDTFTSFDGDDLDENGVVQINVNANCICSRGLTASDFASMAPSASASNRATYINGINETCNEFGIHTCLEKAHFIAQLLHESANLSATAEANVSSTAYGGFPGRGFIQLTYKSMYEKYGKFINDDFTSNETAKQKLETVPHVYLSAGWFYTLGKDKDPYKGGKIDDLLEVSARIQGGFGGLNDRKSKLDVCKNYLKDLCDDAALNNNTYNFSASQIASNTLYSFAWGIWHDSKFTCQSGVTKDDAKAIEGYQVVIGTNTSRKNNYNMLNKSEFDEFQVVEGEQTNIYIKTVAEQRHASLTEDEETEEVENTNETNNNENNDEK